MTMTTQRGRPWRRPSDTGAPAQVWWVAPVAVIGAVSIALVQSRRGDPVAAAAGAWLALAGGALTAADLDVMRLPDAILRPAAAVLAGVLLTGAWVTSRWASLLAAAAMSLALPALMYLWGVLVTGTLGGGDIKLVALTGMATGWLGWPVALYGLATGIILGGIGASILLLSRRRRGIKPPELPYGPYLIAGALAMFLLPGTG